MSSGDRRSCFTFTWTIENFSYCCDRAGVNIKSPTFVINEIQGSKYYLTVFPKGVVNDNAVEIFLQCPRSGPLVKHVYEITCVLKDGSVLKPMIYEVSKKLGNNFTDRKDVFVANTSAYQPDDKLAVRCRIWMKDGEIMDVRCFACTRICIEKISFLWNIQNFSSLRSEHIYQMKSVMCNELLGAFTLFTKNPYTDEDSITIQLVSDNGKIKFLVLHLTLLNGFRNTGKGIRKEFLLSENKQPKLLTLPFAKNDLIANRDVCLPGDVLSFRCDCIFSTGKISHEIESVTYGCESFPASDPEIPCLDKRNTLSISKRILNENIKSLIRDNILADVKLKTGSETFYAHKNILSVWSPVFKAVFEDDSNKNPNECVEIEDLDSDTVYRMLHYAYMAEIQDLQSENACKLYLAAHKYKILALKEECSAFLKSSLCLENVCEVLILADVHQDEELKDSAQDFIFQHDVVNSEKWKKLMKTHVNLAADMMFLQIQRKNLKFLGDIGDTSSKTAPGFKCITEKKPSQSPSTIIKSFEKNLLTSSELNKNTAIKPPTFSFNSSTQQAPAKTIFTVGSNKQTPVKPTISFGRCKKQSLATPTFTIGSSNEPVRPTFSFNSNNAKTSVKPNFSFGNDSETARFQTSFSFNGSNEKKTVNPFFLNSFNLKSDLSFESSFYKQLPRSSIFNSSKEQTPCTSPRMKRSSTITPSESTASNSTEVQLTSPVFGNSDMNLSSACIGFKNDSADKLATSFGFCSISEEKLSKSTGNGEAHSVSDSLPVVAPSEFENTSLKILTDSSVSDNSNCEKLSVLPHSSPETTAFPHFGTTRANIPSASLEFPSGFAESLVSDTLATTPFGLSEFDNRSGEMRRSTEFVFDNSNCEKLSVLPHSSPETTAFHHFGTTDANIPSASLGFPRGFAGSPVSDTLAKTPPALSKFGNSNGEIKRSSEFDRNSDDITSCSAFENASTETQLAGSGFDVQ